MVWCGVAQGAGEGPFWWNLGGLEEGQKRRAALEALWNSWGPRVGKGLCQATSFAETLLVVQEAWVENEDPLCAIAQALLQHKPWLAAVIGPGAPLSLINPRLPQCVPEEST